MKKKPIVFKQVGGNYKDEIEYKVTFPSDPVKIVNLTARNESNAKNVAMAIAFTEDEIDSIVAAFEGVVERV